MREENTQQAADADEQKKQEKQSAAMSSVVAAIFLTSMKVVVGLWTGSLGILAEAAHSGLDLVAALLTFLAVRVSDRPADQQHLYGHDKVENLSALAETILLLITCAWIVYEAINRLFFTHVQVEANLWAFAVMITSIVIDYTRSRILKRAAEKYNSQALEADALHFSTDIWSSCAVIGGLALVKANEMIGGFWILDKADALAALAVAAIVVYVSVEMGGRTIAVLLDTAPDGLANRIRDEVCRIERVAGCRQVRVRRAGAKNFVDIVLEIDGDASFQKAHEITSQAEELVRRLEPHTDVIVHYEPCAQSADAAQDQAAQETLAGEIEARICQVKGVIRCRQVRVHRAGDGKEVDVVLEMERDLSFQAAHDTTSQVEGIVRQVVPQSEVFIHYEPA